MDTLKNMTPLQWMGIVILFNTTLLGGSSQLGDLALSVGTVKAILAVATLGNGFLGGLVTMFGSQATQVRNVLAMPGVEKLTVNGNANAALATIAVDPSVDKITAKAEDLVKVSKTAGVAGMLLLLVMSTALLLPGPAIAQGKTKTAATTTHGMPCDPAHLLPGCQSTLDASGNPIEQLLSQPMQQLADFIAGGFDDAVTLSTAVSNLQDGNGQACWSVLRDYSAVLKAHPIPITLKFAADLESLRLLNMAAKKVCQTASCTQVFNELANGITSLSPISVPIPSISALCAKVPDIAVVSPQIPAATSPSVSASPIPSATTPLPIPAPSPTP